MLKRKQVQGPLYTFFGGKQQSDDKESNTASETPALTKKTCKLPGGMEGKYKWPRFEERENKMFCETCREFPKRKNLQYSRGSEQIISKQTA